MNIKCMSCGLVNWSTATVCRRCNTPVQAQVYMAPPTPPQVQRSIPPPVQTQRPVYPPPQAQAPVFQTPPAQVQRPVFQPPTAYQTPVPYQNPGQAGFPNRQPYANPAGSQQPLPINRPGEQVPLPINRPGQEIPLPINRPGQEVSRSVNHTQQQNGASYATNPLQPFTAPGNGAPPANSQPLQHYPNVGQQPFANPHPMQNHPNVNQQPYQNYSHPQQQPYQNYPYANRPNPQDGQPYVNQQSYPIQSPYTGNPTLPNQQPYQMGYAPPQSLPYAPGRSYAPPPYTAPKSSLGPVAKIFVALIVIGAVVGFAILRAIVNRERTESMGEEALTVKYLKVPNRDSASIEGMRENFFSYLGKDRDYRFGFDEMQRQLFSGIDEIIYDQDKGEVLFLVKDCSQGDPSKMIRIIERYAIDPARVYYGESFKQKAVSFTGKSKLGWTNHCPLVIPVDNIRINPYSAIEIRYTAATYKISAQELADYMTDKSIFSGPMRIFSKDRVQRELNVFGNHGAFVAKPNEPSLTRLASSLTVSGESASREGKIQSLLNFVSSEITYDDVEAKFKGEILKRPDETLLTRRGDCSSKTILMASLLEQIGEEYRLVYYLDHITVAVPQGAFKNTNSLSFAREDRTWVIAETTVPGFVVGETAIENKGIFRNIQYIQRPGTVNGVSAFDNLKEIFLQ
jgi:hypothetical protein